MGFLLILLLVLPSALAYPSKAVKPFPSVNQTCNFTPFRALTFHANLAHDIWVRKSLAFADNRLPRRAALISNLQNSDADIVCLQGIRNGADVVAIVNGLSAKYPHSFSAMHTFAGTLPSGQTYANQRPFCDSTALSALEACRASAPPCSQNVNTKAFTDCLRNKCSAQYTAVRRAGTKCLTCNFRTHPFNSARCRGTGTDPFEEINTTGLLLLSKKPMKDRRSVDFFSGRTQIKPHGYLQAWVDNQYLVTCTDIYTNELSSFEPSFDFTRSAMNDLQTRSLIEDNERKKPHLVLGKFNSGPSGTGKTAVKPDNYRDLLRAFNKTSIVNECTFCSSNPHVVASDTGIGGALDHIFGNKLNITEGRVILKASEASVSGRPLSDSYGVKALVSCCRVQTSGSGSGRKYYYNKQYPWYYYNKNYQYQQAARPQTYQVYW